MNEGLFKKYTEQIIVRAHSKQKIITAIKEKTGIALDELEISLTGKTVHISVSSVKKATLLQKGIKETLKLIGYNLKS